MDGHMHQRHGKRAPPLVSAVLSGVLAPAHQSGDPASSGSAAGTQDTTDSAPATTTTTSASPSAETTTKQAERTTTTTTQAVQTTSRTTQAVERTTDPAPEPTTTRAPRTTAETTPVPILVSSSSSSKLSGTLVVVSTITQSSSSSSSSSGTALASSNSTSSGPATGTVVGIVAGALVGVVVISAIVGYLFRKKWNKADEDDSPFDRDEFRRSSMMLEDDPRTGGYSGSHSPQMSEYSAHNMQMGGGGGGALGRNNSVLPGLGRNASIAQPRPPSSIVNHMHRPQQQFAPPMPSYQPGQVYPGPGAGFNSPPPGMDPYGGYPMQFAQLQHQHSLDRGAYGQQGYGAGHPYAQPTTLDRQPSNASAYSQQDIARGSTRSGPHSAQHHGGDGRLAQVSEEDEQRYTGSRSGTPVNAGVQQAYFSHGRDDSINQRSPSADTTLPGYRSQNGGRRSPTGMTKESRATRTLSVRNGGLDAQGRPMSFASDDAYGGYF